MIKQLECKNIIEYLKTDTKKVLLDVRTQEENDEGHIKKSILVDINLPSLFMESILKLKKNKSYYVYCRTGIRSEMACSLMYQNGLTAYLSLIHI